MERRYKRIQSSILEILQRPDMTILPGQLAFFFILSLVPTITILMYFATFLSISIEDISNYFNIAKDSAIIELLTPYIGSTEWSFSLFIVIIVGIYIASNGMNSIILTANSVYGIEQSPWLERRVKSIIMVLILILLLLFILLVPVFGTFLLSLIENITGLEGLYNILNFLKTPFSWFMIFFFIKILYTIAPDKQIPSAYVNLGALFTSIGWMLATEVYLYYVGNYAHYNVYYSGLSNIAVLMIWIYLLSTIFVIGMGINFKEEPYEEERTQRLLQERIAKKSQHKKSDKQ